MTSRTADVRVCGRRPIPWPSLPPPTPARFGEAGTLAASHARIPPSSFPPNSLTNSGEDSPALRRIDDARGHGGKVSDDVVFGVEGELRVDGQVGRPVARRGCRDSAQVDVITSSVELDLDTPRLTQTSASRGD